MKWGGYIGGIYPRSERLIEATRRSPPNLKNLFIEEKRRIIRYQVEAELTYIADPMIDWQDQLRPLLKLKGVKEGPLNRIYETNSFYRRPIIVDRIEGGGGLIRSNLSTDLLPKDKAWKAELPDPYTFTTLSENRHYRDWIDLMMDLASALRMEAKSLEEAGYSLIQINAPSLGQVREEEAIKRIGEAIARLTKGLNTRFHLHIYFTDPRPILDKITEFKVQGIGLDLTQKPDLPSVNLSGKSLACGCIDAGSTRMERPRDLAEYASKLAERFGAREAYICPNHDLEYIPYAFANRKLSRMKATLKILWREAGRV